MFTCFSQDLTRSPSGVLQAESSCESSIYGRFRQSGVSIDGTGSAAPSRAGCSAPQVLILPCGTAYASSSPSPDGRSPSGGPSGSMPAPWADHHHSNHQQHDQQRHQYPVLGPQHQRASASGDVSDTDSVLFQDAEDDGSMVISSSAVSPVAPSASAPAEEEDLQPLPSPASDWQLPKANGVAEEGPSGSGPAHDEADDETWLQPPPLHALSSAGQRSSPVPTGARDSNSSVSSAAGPFSRTQGRRAAAAVEAANRHNDDDNDVDWADDRRRRGGDAAPIPLPILGSSLPESSMLLPQPFGSVGALPFMSSGSEGGVPAPRFASAPAGALHRLQDGSTLSALDSCMSDYSLAMLLPAHGSREGSADSPNADGASPTSSTPGSTVPSWNWQQMDDAEASRRSSLDIFLYQSTGRSPSAFSGRQVTAAAGRHSMPHVGGTTGRPPLPPMPPLPRPRDAGLGIVSPVGPPAAAGTSILAAAANAVSNAVTTQPSQPAEANKAANGGKSASSRLSRAKSDSSTGEFEFPDGGSDDDSNSGSPTLLAPPSLNHSSSLTTGCNSPSQTNDHATASSTATSTPAAAAAAAAADVAQPAPEHAHPDGTLLLTRPATAPADATTRSFGATVKFQSPDTTTASSPEQSPTDAPTGNTGTPSYSSSGSPASPTVRPRLQHVASIGSWLNRFGSMLAAPSADVQLTQAQHDPLSWYPKHVSESRRAASTSSVPAALHATPSSADAASALENVASGFRAPLHSPARPLETEGFRPEAVAALRLSQATFFPASASSSPAQTRRDAVTDAFTVVSPVASPMAPPPLGSPAASSALSAAVQAAIAASPSIARTLPPSGRRSTVQSSDLQPPGLPPLPALSGPSANPSLSPRPAAATVAQPVDALTALLNSPRSPVSALRVVRPLAEQQALAAAMRAQVSSSPRASGLRMRGSSTGSGGRVGFRTLPGETALPGASVTRWSSDGNARMAHDVPHNRPQPAGSAAAGGSGAAAGAMWPLPVSPRPVVTPRRQLLRVLSAPMGRGATVAAVAAAAAVAAEVPAASPVADRAFVSAFDAVATSPSPAHRPAATIAAAAGGIDASVAQDSLGSPRAGQDGGCPDTPTSRVAATQSVSSPFHPLAAFPGAVAAALSALENNLAGAAAPSSRSFEEEWEDAVRAGPRRAGPSGARSVHTSPLIPRMLSHPVQGPQRQQMHVPSRGSVPAVPAWLCSPGPAAGKYGRPLSREVPSAAELVRGVGRSLFAEEEEEDQQQQDSARAAAAATMVAAAAAAVAQGLDPEAEAGLAAQQQLLHSGGLSWSDDEEDEDAMPSSPRAGSVNVLFSPDPPGRKHEPAPSRAANGKSPSAAAPARRGAGASGSQPTRANGGSGGGSRRQRRHRLSHGSGNTAAAAASVAADASARAAPAAAPSTGPRVSFDLAPFVAPAPAPAPAQPGPAEGVPEPNSPTRARPAAGAMPPASPAPSSVAVATASPPSPPDSSHSGASSALHSAPTFAQQLPSASPSASDKEGDEADPDEGHDTGDHDRDVFGGYGSQDEVLSSLRDFRGSGAGAMGPAGKRQSAGGSQPGSATLAPRITLSGGPLVVSAARSTLGSCGGVRLSQLLEQQDSGSVAASVSSLDGAGEGTVAGRNAMTSLLSAFSSPRDDEHRPEAPNGSSSAQQEGGRDQESRRQPSPFLNSSGSPFKSSTTSGAVQSSAAGRRLLAASRGCYSTSHLLDTRDVSPPRSPADRTSCPHSARPTASPVKSPLVASRSSPSLLHAGRPTTDPASDPRASLPGSPVCLVPPSPRFASNRSSLNGMSATPAALPAFATTAAYVSPCATDPRASPIKVPVPIHPDTRVPHFSTDPAPAPSLSRPSTAPSSSHGDSPAPGRSPTRPTTAPHSPGQALANSHTPSTFQSEGATSTVGTQRMASGSAGTGEVREELSRRSWQQFQLDYTASVHSSRPPASSVPGRASTPAIPATSSEVGSSGPAPRASAAAALVPPPSPRARSGRSSLTGLLPSVSAFEGTFQAEMDLRNKRVQQQQKWDRVRAESRANSTAGTPRSARALFPAGSQPFNEQLEKATAAAAGGVSGSSSVPNMRQRASASCTFLHELAGGVPLSPRAAHAAALPPSIFALDPLLGGVPLPAELAAAAGAVGPSAPAAMPVMPTLNAMGCAVLPPPSPSSRQVQRQLFTDPPAATAAAPTVPAPGPLLPPPPPLSPRAPPMSPRAPPMSPRAPPMSPRAPPLSPLAPPLSPRAPPHSADPLDSLLGAMSAVKVASPVATRRWATCSSFPDAFSTGLSTSTAPPVPSIPTGPLPLPFPTALQPVQPASPRAPARSMSTIDQLCMQLEEQPQQVHMPPRRSQTAAQLLSPVVPPSPRRGSHRSSIEQICDDLEDAPCPQQLNRVEAPGERSPLPPPPPPGSARALTRSLSGGSPLLQAALMQHLRKSATTSCLPSEAELQQHQGYVAFGRDSRASSHTSSSPARASTTLAGAMEIISPVEPPSSSRPPSASGPPAPARAAPSTNGLISPVAPAGASPPPPALSGSSTSISQLPLLPPMPALPPVGAQPTGHVARASWGSIGVPPSPRRRSSSVLHDAVLAAANAMDAAIQAASASASPVASVVSDTASAAATSPQPVRRCLFRSQTFGNDAATEPFVPGDAARQPRSPSAAAAAAAQAPVFGLLQNQQHHHTSPNTKATWAAPGPSRVPLPGMPSAAEQAAVMASAHLEKQFEVVEAAAADLPLETRVPTPLASSEAAMAALGLAGNTLGLAVGVGAAPAGAHTTAVVSAAAVPVQVASPVVLEPTPHQHHQQQHVRPRTAPMASRPGSVESSASQPGGRHGGEASASQQSRQLRHQNSAGAGSSSSASEAARSWGSTQGSDRPAPPLPPPAKKQPSADAGLVSGPPAASAPIAIPAPVGVAGRCAAGSSISSSCPAPAGPSTGTFLPQAQAPAQQPRPAAVPMSAAAASPPPSAPPPARHQQQQQSAAHGSPPGTGAAPPLSPSPPDRAAAPGTR